MSYERMTSELMLEAAGVRTLRKRSLQVSVPTPRLTASIVLAARVAALTGARLAASRRMKLVVFGLTLSSSWGNGHATLWRGLVRALARSGHHVTFFERDVPYYADHRDLNAVPGAQLVLYVDWASVQKEARRHVEGADALIVTSYCEDAVAASRLAQEVGRRPLCVFYDLDTPVTLARLRAGERVAYLPPEGLGLFDLVLSYAGGEALESLRQALGARHVAPLYGHADMEAHRAAQRPALPGGGNGARFDLSYLGTYARDRQP